MVGRYANMATLFQLSGQYSLVMVKEGRLTMHVQMTVLIFVAIVFLYIGGKIGQLFGKK